MEPNLTESEVIDDLQELPVPQVRRSEDEWAHRWVPGLATIAKLAGFYRPATPTNVYAIEERSESGIVGTVYPSGEFVSLQSRTPEYAIEYWEDACACKRPGTVVWNGNAKGGLDRPADGPMRRVFDGTLMGLWPVNPPREGKVVNPEKARYAAQLELLDQQRNAQQS